jgi:CubicO group peptidase (beta-lactamase class C family)
MVSGGSYELKRTSPEQQGVASSAILQFVEALGSQVHEIHSFMLLRHGCVIAEGWWAPYAAQHPHLLFSVSKSFTATAVGLAIHEGYFSIDDPVVDFFPHEHPAEVSVLLAEMRVRHLLSMSTGQAVDSWSFLLERQDGNWSRGFFEVPVLHMPGTHFVYNTGATYILSAIVQKTTGMNLLDYLQPRLFEPLGIEKPTWQESPQGITAGGIGLRLRTEDVARFGQLYLQNGMWQGQQILPAGWVSEATAAQIAQSSGMQLDWQQGYGYQFWRCRHGAYRGDGVFGQYCVVMPEQDAVLAITSGIDIFEMQQPLNLVWDVLLPAMQPNALPIDPLANDALAARLSTLALPVVVGEHVSSMTSQVSGQRYAVDLNDLNIKTLRFELTKSGHNLRVETLSGEESIPWGFGKWLRGETRLFHQPLLYDHTRTAASGAWTAHNVLTLRVQLYETPFFYTLACHFFDDEIMVEIQVNISLESLKPLLLTGRSVAHSV